MYQRGYKVGVQVMIGCSPSHSLNSAATFASFVVLFQRRRSVNKENITFVFNVFFVDGERQ